MDYFGIVFYFDFNLILWIRFVCSRVLFFEVVVSVIVMRLGIFVCLFRIVGC